jgi:hypothetical protein
MAARHTSEGAIMTPPQTSTVPGTLKRAGTAAEEVIAHLERGSPGRSQTEARLLKLLAHGQVADDLAGAGAPRSMIREFQQRADRVAQLSATGAPNLRVSLAASHASQLIPGFYSLYRHPVPAAVLRLDQLGRQIQLRSLAGETAQVRRLVKAQDATWTKLRPQVIAAGATLLVRRYDAHVRELEQDGRQGDTAQHAREGLELVAQMEKAFLAR